MIRKFNLFVCQVSFHYCHSPAKPKPKIAWVNLAVSTVPYALMFILNNLFTYFTPSSAHELACGFTTLETLW